uniref:Uncharacterized protein n=1 Tax=Ditylenchus dipsaci TaxID=166011 RepID=A0A915DH83_9BILA
MIENLAFLAVDLAIIKSCLNYIAESPKRSMECSSSADRSFRLQLAPPQQSQVDRFLFDASFPPLVIHETAGD